eukprot:jgi/Botrbrau1/17158/Bobra.0157s0052.1
MDPQPNGRHHGVEEEDDVGPRPPEDFDPDADIADEKHVQDSTRAIPTGSPTLSDEDLVGPAAPKPKRRKVLQHEGTYLQGLPSADMYECSLMHRDTVTHVVSSDAASVFASGSVDGHIKFWKRTPEGIEFAKHFRAHLAPVDGLAVSADGALLASISRDGTVKVFDVSTFDMMAMMPLPFVPACCEWIFKGGDAKAKLAIADKSSNLIHVYDMRSGSDEALMVFKGHVAPVTAMRFNVQYETVISTDEKGHIEYWGSNTGTFPEGALGFRFKIDTDLFAHAQAKTVVRDIAVAHDGRQFATVSDDRKFRVFGFKFGKLKRTYDEAPESAAEVQRSEAPMFHLEPIDFGRRMAVERELIGDPAAPPPNVVFDESGNFIIYASLLGIKVVNVVTNRVVRILGKVENTERFVRIALYQGGRKGAARAKLAGTSSRKAELQPTIMACAYHRQRVYFFTQREPPEQEDALAGRDIFNEKPNVEETLATEGGGTEEVAAELPRGVVMHTSRGDITLRLFPDECPRTVENFTTHARSGYYDGVIFHRVIKGFMIQTGDPLGDGTGGQSIWGTEFPDEFSRNLRHDRPFTLSMANAGPNTNGSQFFITIVPTPWLDNKHTVFGRVVKGGDVVNAIERVKTDRNDKPFDEIKILSIEVKASVD